MAASLALGTCIALASVSPAFAEHTTAGTGTAGDSRTLNGASVPARTYYPNAGRTDSMPLDRTTDGTYGGYNTNGTFGMNGTNGTYGAYDTNRMNTYRPLNNNTNNTTNVRARANDNTVRRMDTTPARTGFSWGWLGLLGLFGLAGMRSRNREDAR
ncbi:WGxxGxxG family protein [Cohnella hongkongensis]|uniref:WGxxGxxG family protein n=1 Tax=Cohnella hongkongensis TaxID=178337 RepID=A0ABV9F4N3_9BACL